jgi:eukaryotic-like serine/threonine-protein kinase
MTGQFMTQENSDGFCSTERFEIISELGAGAMGVVYEVLDCQNNIIVALKTLKGLDGRRLFRFKQEFRAMTELNHPNLIQLHELFADGDLWYFTMEYVPGMTFMEYLGDESQSSIVTQTESDIQADVSDEIATVDYHESSENETPAEKSATSESPESPATLDVPTADYASIPEDAATVDYAAQEPDDVSAIESPEDRPTVDIHGTLPDDEQPTREIHRTDQSHVDPGATVDGRIPVEPKQSSVAKSSLAQSPQAKNLERLRESFRQLALGLIELHSKGMLHRDIKPANVIIAPDGRVVLLDFGLVAEMNSTKSISADGLSPPEDVNIYETVEQGIAGTVAYMAPEQAQGKQLSVASDWYAVGTMMYEALTERLPYRGKIFDVLRKKVRQDPIPPSELNSSVPAELSDLTMQLMKRNPKKRLVGQRVVDILMGEDPNARVVDSSRDFILNEDIPFVGRENEIEALLSALNSAKDACTVVAEVHGASGMGKSMLIDEFVKRRECQGDVIVLQGRCYEQESVPYKAIDGIIDQLTRFLMKLPAEECAELLPSNMGRLARLFPVLKRVKLIDEMMGNQTELADPRQLRLTAIAALGQLIDSITETKTLLLTIDDMQWGDVDSAILLNQLLQFGFEYRLLLVIGYRVEYVNTSPCLKTLHKGKWRTGETATGSLSLSEGWTATGTVSFKSMDLDLPATSTIAAIGSMLKRIEIPILPLSPVSVCELVMSLLPKTSSVSNDVIQQIVNEARGNPYFALELVRYVESGREFDVEDGNVLYLDEVLWNRIQSLPETAQSFLHVIAVAGQPMVLRNVFRASQLIQLKPGDMRLLHTGRFVRSTGTGLDDEVATFHDRVRESIVDRLAPDTLTEIHQAIGDTLAVDPNADLELVAHSFHQAGDRSKACRFYIRAADATSTALAFARAAELYRLSLELLDSDPKLEFELRKKLAVALANAGLGTEAAEEYHEAARLAEGSERIELDSLAAFHYCTGGRIEKGRRLLQQGLNRVGLKVANSSLRVLLGIVKQRVILWFRGYRFKQRPESEVNPKDLLKIDTAWRAAKALSLFDTLAGVYVQGICCEWH